MAWNRIQAAARAHIELLSELEHFVDQELQECLTVTLHFSLD